MGRSKGHRQQVCTNRLCSRDIRIRIGDQILHFTSGKWIVFCVCWPGFLSEWQSLAHTHPTYSAVCVILKKPSSIGQSVDHRWLVRVLYQGVSECICQARVHLTPGKPTVGSLQHTCTVTAGKQSIRIGG